jgi:2-keto-3-deoxy-L-rhamnonate aldolase RhmA/pimeloyl-ACP methyl ester carboxylesterase
MQPLAKRLAAGESLTALLAKLPCAAQVEAAGHAGFDVVLLDTEHGPGDALALEEHLRAAAAVGIAALVRVPALDPAAILGALDAGADGVVVPHVLDAAGAEAAVAAAHYPPRGRRGLALSTRAGHYGAAALEDHLQRSAEETCVIVQIEDREAVEAADAILAVPGVSGVLVGATDLAMSLGHAPDREIEAVTAAATRAGVPVLRVAEGAGRPDGAQVVAHVATNLVRDAFAAAVANARDPAERGEIAANARAAGSGEVAWAAAGAAALPGRLGVEPVPVLLLPGMLGDATLWDDVAPTLGAARFGRIDFDDSIAEMAATVLASAPERFALAGHSLGAIVALEIMRQAPARVTRLALLNANARPASEAQLAAWAAMRDGEFDAVVRDFATANTRAQLTERVEGMARAVGPRGLRRQLAAQASRPDSRPWLAAITVPTLVLTGTEDAICPRELQEELVAGIPRARHVVVEGAGHMAPLEDPAAVTAHLQHWLEGER